MSVAKQDAQIGAPGTDNFAVLVSQYTGYLMQVSKIMNGPCRQKLRQRHCPEGRMFSPPGQICLL